AGAATLGAVVLPRTRPRPQPQLAPGEGITLRFLSANCLKGGADPRALMALIHELEPDVVALQEQDRHLLRLLDLEGIGDVLPHRVVNPGGRMSDAGLLSRFPLTPVAPELSSVFVAAEATLPGGQGLPLMAFHPLPPVGRDYTTRWTDAMEEIPAADGTFAGGVLCGDFNATLDHPEFRAVLGRGWRDAARECGGAMRATWSEFGLLRLTIDHILVSEGAAVSDYRVHRLRGSDHRAISAVVTVPTPARG
ncbi:MAG: endonuclease/exonuclease/phosphatase family protein, partial [Solirubrobacteraceae bacterium]|nr:endonuclease/exonuclease/phosphatase family protein [Solirubrobacteraceae bacterium]